MAAIADDIAYDNHDIDDGLRAGLLTLDQLLSVPLVQRSWDAARARFPDCAPERLMGELVRGQIGAMVNDLVAEMRTRIAASGVGSADDVRAAGTCLAHFSPPMREAERELKRFMYANLYHHPRQRAAVAGGRACAYAILVRNFLSPPAPGRGGRRGCGGGRRPVRRLSRRPGGDAVRVAAGAPRCGARPQPPHRRLHCGDDRSLRYCTIPRGGRRYRSAGRLLTFAVLHRRVLLQPSGMHSFALDHGPFSAERRRDKIAQLSNAMAERA